MKDQTEKLKRLELANQCIQIIATHGRRFLYHRGQTARFELTTRFVSYIDACGGKVHPYGVSTRWRHFSEGGTMQYLIDDLRKYITTGKVVPHGHFGSWPKWYSDGDPWGYEDDMKIVRMKVYELGIVGKMPDVKVVKP